MPLARAAVSDWGKIKRLNLYYNGCSACMSVSYPLPWIKTDISTTQVAVLSTYIYLLVIIFITLKSLQITYIMCSS